MAAVCPETFLYRMGGGATSAAFEIWATAHRQYVILATCQKTDTATRLFAFRCFMRLVMRYRQVLVSDSETCPLCRRNARLNNKFSATENIENTENRAATAANCCWYRPDARGTAVLALLRKLGRMESQGTADVDGLAENFYLAKLYGDRAPNETLDELYSLFEV
ncbi:hypothetical protein F503_02800 [Ophiostoma piceae UAMH 11346]|uniref:Uncharacterized protein n=1 Tax=Ophiostoma piceae (strain UAMH 11346) TaxID=1262450 RepID=S3C2I4_OPHP1|nr:hypothetical protein F503_02800 [Ophiostoma piceae UAMH 11346]